MGIRNEKLKFWASNRKHLLMLGYSGVGKTAMTMAFFKENGLSFDTNVAQWSIPLLDFVGTKPTEASVLFFDNLNDQTALQAANEIIALRRWRGQEISPAACVWGCYTTAYDDVKENSVDTPATLEGRFEVVVAIPTRVDLDWFTERFGKTMAFSALTWWDNLPYEEKMKVTPRRLEQALQMYLDKGDIRDVLPMTCNASYLMAAISSGPIADKLDELIATNNVAEAAIQASSFHIGNAWNHICAKPERMDFFLPLIPYEKLLTQLPLTQRTDSGLVALKHMIVNVDRVPAFAVILRRILIENKEPWLAKRIRKMMTDLSLPSWDKK